MSEWYDLGPEDEEQQPDPLPQAQAPAPAPVPAPVVALFFNKYRHCGIEWEDTCESTCSDKCPCCGEEITPYESEALL